MNAALAGQTLTGSDFRVPQLANASLAGQTVEEVLPRGKHLLLRTSAGLTLRTHFKMEGAWCLYRPDDKWVGPGHEIRLVLHTEDWVAVGYRLSLIDLVLTEKERDLVGHLGPDILGPDWDLAEAVARLNQRSKMTIGEALLDQTCLAGIGNLYKNETLFLRGLYPWTAVNETPSLEAVVTLAQRLMKLNTEHAIQTTTGHNRKGRQWWVMERPGKPCRRCGSLIRVAKQGQHYRLTYWCPHCQPDRAGKPAGSTILPVGAK